MQHTAEPSSIVINPGKAALSAFSIILISITMAVSTGCQQKPSDVLKTIEKTAAAGDAEGFASCFTKESRPYAEALILLQKGRYNAQDDRKSPIEMISTSNVVSEKIEGDTATVKISTADGTTDIVFLREGGAWKLNVAETEGRRIQDTGEPK